MSKVILVLSDGLGYDVAVAYMGYLGHLVESGLASLYKIVGEIPGISRPMYETIHTGLPACQHGIVTNSVVRLSKHPNIFRVVKDAGRITAASAYYWFSELYNRIPFDRINDRELDDTFLSIQHGRFYSEDGYPDSEVFASSAMLMRRFSPDYLLVHPMGMDYIGEIHGADSKQYKDQAVQQDMWLAPLLEEWLGLGYTVLVTGDHGINKDGIHGGPASDQREVPLYLLPPDRVGQGDTGRTISHLQIAPTVLNILSLPIPATMKQPPLF